MNTKININGKEVEITLTVEQIKVIKNHNTEITERVFDFKSACEELNIKTHEDAYKLLNLKRTLNSDLKIDQCEDSYLKLIIWTLALNEGKPIDLTKENGYFPYFNHKNKPGSGFFRSCCFFWSGSSYVSSRLALRTSKLALYSGKQFEQEHYNYNYM